MRVVVGSGANRHEFDRPTDKVSREKMAEDIKMFLRQRGTLARGR